MALGETLRIALLLAKVLFGWRRTGPLPHVAGVPVAVVVIAALVKLRWPTFAYKGDNAESFLPLWHALGAKLLSGEWIGYDPHGWAGANIAGESAYGIYNPVTLANESGTGIAFTTASRDGGWAILGRLAGRDTARSPRARRSRPGPGPTGSSRCASPPGSAL